MPSPRTRRWSPATSARSRGCAGWRSSTTRSCWRCSGVSDGAGGAPGAAVAAGAARGGGLGTGFRRVWASVTVSGLGDGMRFAALPLLAAELTSDPRRVAAVALAEQLPWLLMSLPAGVLADRLDRRRLMWTVDAGRALLVAGLAVAVAAHAVTIPLLLVAGFLLGCGQTLYNGAWSGIVPMLVAPDDLVRANARLQSGFVITETLMGAPAGAVLFGVGAALPFTADAVSFAVAAALVVTVRGEFRTGAGPGARTLRGLRRDTAEGLRGLWADVRLRRLCVASGLTSLVSGGLIAVMVLYARQALGLGGTGFALLVVAFALGGVGGAASAPRLTARLGVAHTLVLTAVGMALAAACAGAARSGWIAGVCVLGYGAANLAWTVTAVSRRQYLVPAELMGRVTMAYQMITGTGTALGTAASGALAHALGLRAPFYLGGAVLLVTAALSRRRAGRARGAEAPVRK
ncbi:MFS transporter [Streptomyces sp. NPDC004959]|uniref:MFS transporter n=1 Tax=Streptomyces sp. NPDC004959 TaxID=3154673 RepID=UPI0033B8D86F